jgi:membrane protein
MTPLRDLIWQTIQKYFKDRVPRMAAALAYYTAFSIAPLLVIVTAVAGFFIGEETATGAIASQIENAIGPQAANFVENAIRSAGTLEGSWISASVSVGVLIFGATIVFLQLQDALNKVWDVPVEERGDGLRSIILKRVISFGMVLASGFLLLVSLVVSSLLSAFGKVLETLVPASGLLMQAINQTVAFVVITGLFALIYRYLPDTKIRWREVWPGAIVTGLLFTIGKYLLGLYLGMAAPTSIYGAAGSFAVILLWVYYTAQIVLFGASFAYLYAEQREHKQSAPKLQTRLSNEQRGEA